MRHEFISLSQNDPQWKDLPLGKSPSVTIGQAGCYLTAYCLLATYYGHSTLPPVLNEIFKHDGLFVNQDYISSDDDLSKVYQDVSYTTSHSYPNTPPTPADLGLLQTLLADSNIAVIVGIDLGNGQRHFTPVIDCDGTTVTILNVWNGKEQTVNQAYGDPAEKILKFVVYSGKHLDDPLVCDKKSVRDQLVAMASSTREIGNYLNDPETIFTAGGYGGSVVSRIKDLQQAAASIKRNVLPSQTVAQAIPTEQQKSLWQKDISTLWSDLFGSKGGGN